jgi:hypothetical protein
MIFEEALPTLDHIYPAELRLLLHQEGRVEA